MIDNPMRNLRIGALAFGIFLIASVPAFAQQNAAPITTLPEAAPPSHGVSIPPAATDVKRSKRTTKSPAIPISGTATISDAIAAPPTERSNKPSPIKATTPAPKAPAKLEPVAIPSDAMTTPPSTK